MSLFWKQRWLCMIVWGACACPLAAQNAPPPPVPRPPGAQDIFPPEDAPPPPNGYLPVPPQEGVIPTTVVPNSGYSGGGSQWDHQTIIGESPTYQEPEGCIGGGCRDSSFTPLASTTQGVALLTRGRASGVLSTDLFTVVDPVTKLPVIGPDGRPNLRRLSAFGGGDLPFQMAPGYDEVVERYLGRDANNFDWYLQGGFRGFNDWVSRATIDSKSRRVTDLVLTPAPVLITHGGLNSFFGGPFSAPVTVPQPSLITVPPPYLGLDWVDRHTFQYGSEFNSAEFGVVLRQHPRSDRIVLYPNGEWHREEQPGAYWSFLAGVRYFNIDEGFLLRGFTTDRPFEPAPTALLSGAYFSHTHNELIGLQLGTELTWRDRGWELGFRFRVSPMVNTAEAESRINTLTEGVIPLIPDKHESYRFVDTRVAAILDLGVLGTYRLSEAWAIRAGYDTSWLTGAALAPSQQPTVAKRVVDNSTVFIQGLILGLEYRR